MYGKHTSRSGLPGVYGQSVSALRGVTVLAVRWPWLPRWAAEDWRREVSRRQSGASRVESLGFEARARWRRGRGPSRGTHVNSFAGQPVRSLRARLVASHGECTSRQEITALRCIVWGQLEFPFFLCTDYGFAAELDLQVVSFSFIANEDRVAFLAAGQMTY